MDEDDLEIYFSGVKIYDRKGNFNSSRVLFDYKLYDSNGYVVESGSIVTQQVCVGDQFNDSQMFFNLKIGETYTLEFLDNT